VPLYALRYTALMLYAAAGTDLKTTRVVMVHSDPGTTLKVYTHFVEERAARNVDALLGPGGAKTGRFPSNGNVKRRKRRR
jgi:integrase